MDETDSKMVDSDSARQKQAACLECRRSKTKCIRTPDANVCRKCQQSGSDCVIPQYHVGRYKGVKNKRSGLEKAIAQVEHAIKRSRTSENGLDETQAEALHLLLKGTTSPSLAAAAASSVPCDSSAQFTARPPLQRAQTQPLIQQRSANLHSPIPPAAAANSFTDDSEDSGEVTVNNADNPLQLLAIASAIPSALSVVQTPSTVHRTPRTEIDHHGLGEYGTQDFFTPLKSKLDTLPDLDPIELGLISDEEARRMFAYFHNHLAHTRWGMDTNLHTATFVRSRSAFLFTSVVAASALFLPDTAALSKRLQNHVKRLAHVIAVDRYRSVEIVLAFMINVPWMVPGKHWAEDDDTCYYLSLALTIALDLQLNKIVIPSSTMRPLGFLERVSRSDCIEATRALGIDGHANIDPVSVFGKRLLRTRERVWLALFNLDRGVCLARGRPPTVPTGPLLESCDSWHISEVAESQDGPLTSSTVLRRDIVGLISSVRETCDTSSLSVGKRSEVVKHIKEEIEKFFENWFATWSVQIQQPNGGFPPYVEILASHTKLSAYCNVINHPTAALDVKQFFRAAGLATALNVLRVAIQSEPRMKSMPNNTVIMVSFAACFVLGLGTSRTESKALATPNVRPLVQEMADVLERIGSFPEHRRGASAQFGRHIKSILQQSKSLHSSPLSQHRHLSSIYKSTIASAVDHYTQEVLLGNSTSVEHNQFVPNQIGPESYSVFDMTDDQLLEAITNPRNAFEQPNDNFLYDENQFLNWFESWG